MGSGALLRLNRERNASLNQVQARFRCGNCRCKRIRVPSPLVVVFFGLMASHSTTAFQVERRDFPPSLPVRRSFSLGLVVRTRAVRARLQLLPAQLSRRVQL